MPRHAAIARLVLGLLLALASAACAPPALEPYSRSNDAALLYAAHRDEGGFFNPWAPWPHRALDVLRWTFSRNAYERRGDPEIPVVPADAASLRGVEQSASVIWVGHATFAVHDDADVFLTDPHFGKRALIPARVVPPGLPIEAIPDRAFAVVSHNHYDHLDAWSVERLPQTMHWFVPLGLADWFRERGRAQVVELDWWESVQHGRWTITCLPSQHWSRRIGEGENESLWCSWLLDSGERRYYFAGDTGYFHGFAEFGRRFGPIDVAMLPIGAYAPRWFMQYQHMDPAQAYRAFRELGADWMLPMHWGTFDLTDEPLDLPPRELARAVAEAGGDPSRVRLLAVGERWHLPEAAAAESGALPGTKPGPEASLP